MTKPTRRLWPIFICYRRVDGGQAAWRLYEILNKHEDTDSDGHPIQLDVYLDESVPGVADWKALHRPYLEKARALIVVCTPGARLNEGPGDWVHKELDWWLAHRSVAPILIDPLMEGPRYVPTQIARKWPDIQRIPLLEKEWAGVSGTALRHKVQNLRRSIIGALLPSGAAIYEKELLEERRRALRLARALSTARRDKRIAAAALLDAQAAASFDEFRLIASRTELEMSRRRDIRERIASGGDPVREINLRHELEQISADIAALKYRSKGALEPGRALLARADREWEALTATGVRAKRTRPESPHVFSVELVNAGAGESILVHYGTPDDIKLMMINAGPGSTFHTSIAPRLQQLSLDRCDGEPLPIELFIVGDRDEDKTGGLRQMLLDIDNQNLRGLPPLVKPEGIWANLFTTNGTRDFRAHIRRLADKLAIPLNTPFDEHVMRPEHGRAQLVAPNGLEVVVLGPTERHLTALYELCRQEATRAGGTILPFVAEKFQRIKIDTSRAPLLPSEPDRHRGSNCRPSENARDNARGAYIDASVPNLASLVLLFRFRGLTFLFTGDSRGDLILEGLEAAGLLDQKGRAAVDLMTVPHLGSSRNVTVDFFKRVRAAGYLFSGNGRHGNPDVETVAALITARGCDSYQMYFVNRDGGKERSAETMGAKFDAFFKEEQRFHPNYRRVFRSTTEGSVIIDLLTPLHR